jgi:uncharacterized protein YbjT (DUF2867 family)
MPIAITGATGHLGRLVIDDLLSAGVPGTDLIAIARDPDKALALTNAGVQVRVADYNDRDSIQAALVGVDKMLLISSPQIGSRVPQHRNIIDAATTARVSYVAYTSVLHADISHIGLAAEHYVTENAIASSGLNFYVPPQRLVLGELHHQRSWHRARIRAADRHPARCRRRWPPRRRRPRRLCPSRGHRARYAGSYW